METKNTADAAALAQAKGDSDSSSGSRDKDPGIEQVYRYLMFGISLPERTVRSTAAMIGGVIDESATLLVPQAFRDSKTYNTFVQQMLDTMSRNVGGVGERESDPCKSDNSSKEDGDDVEGFVARKAAGTFIDLAGMATLHVSPLTILAIVCDVAYGSKTYLKELADELKREGVISADSSINNAAELLEAVGAVAANTADAFDLPPLSVEGLHETIESTQASVSGIDPTLIIPESEITRLWTDMQAMADREGVNVFEISSAMTMYTLERVNTVSQGALTTIRVTGSLIDRHMFDHYRQGLDEILDRGFYAMVADSSQPYVEAVWYNFSTDRPTVTEDIVTGKMIGRVWEGVMGWFAPANE
ncbi:MAG: hypothetical protein P8J27_00760 [Mariniblastus sp.]|nr:hypothetical protein [Mariniblastus sp.]